MAYTPQTSRRKVYPHGSRGPRHDRVKDDALLGTLKTALEGLFSDANWSTDEAFKSLADSKGWIPLVRQLRHFIMMIVCAGGCSECLITRLMSGHGLLLLIPAVRAN